MSSTLQAPSVSRSATRSTDRMAIMLPERFDVHVASAIDDLLSRRTPGADTEVRVTASSVRFMDQAGLDALARLATVCDGTGAVLRFVDPSIAFVVTCELTANEMLMAALNAGTR